MYGQFRNVLKTCQKRQITNSARLLVNNTTIDKVSALDISPQLKKLLEENAESISYSSFVESLSPSWRQANLQSRRTRKEINDQLLASVKVKPFSIALQYMQENGDQDVKIPADIPNQRTSVSNANTAALRTTRSNANTTNAGIQAWMNDYEAYAANEQDDDSHDTDESSSAGIYGTADPSEPVSKIPCHGCGALLHCAEPSLPGYLPSEIFANQRAEYLRSITCQRCHFLRHYNTVIDVSVPPAEYVRLISSIQDRYALVILMVDLTDFPCSIWPNISEIIGTRRPVIVVGNKVDLLPRDASNYLAHVRNCLEEAVALTGIQSANIKHTCLISAETGYGIEELITKLHNVWAYRGDVYLLGCTNVGKSTLFNALLRSDYCKSKATDLISKATASPWPGTTMRMLKFPIMRPNDWRMFVRTKRIMSQRGQRNAEAQLRRDQAMATRRPEHATLIGHIDQTFRKIDAVDEVSDSFGMGNSKAAFADTLNERQKEYATSKWCYDTPGVVQPEQTLNLLTTNELLMTIAKRMIVPRTFQMKSGQTLFLAGLGRLDYIGRSVPKLNGETKNDADVTQVTVYACEKLPILIVDTVNATLMYERLLGSPVLAVPHIDADDARAGAERLSRWPQMIGKTVVVHGVDDESKACCDIVLSSAGWIGINAAAGVAQRFQVWTPEGRGIVKRVPALVPFGHRLSGHRLRGSLSHQNRRAFI